MEITVKENGSFERELCLSIPWKECKPEYDRALSKIRKKIKIPGFRPGKVPMQVLLNQYQSLIEAEFMDQNIQLYYQKALKVKELEPINQAKVSDVDFKYGENFSFRTSFEIEPTIEIPKLKKNKLKVVRPIYETDEQDLTNAIDEYRQSQTQVQTIEDGAQNDDFIFCDLQETDADANPLIGKKIEKQYLKVGSPHFSRETNAILTGVRPGDIRKITLESGENVSHYSLSCINVERHTLPDITDDFVKKIDPGLSNVDEWKDKIRKIIASKYESKSEEEFSQNINNSVVDFVDPAYPSSMEEGYLDSLVEDVKKSGEKIEDESKIREMFRPSAIRNLKLYLIRKAIIKEQDLSVSVDEVEEKIKKSCLDNPSQEKEIKKYYKKPSNKKQLSNNMLDQKMTEYLKQFAKVTTETIKTADLRKKEMERSHER